MTEIPDLCPSCLTELPADYAFDHVAVDLALSNRPELFRAMNRSERAEVIRTGLARGMTVNALAGRFGSTGGSAILRYLPEQEAQAVHGRADVRRQIRELWDQDLDDATIALRLGRHVGTVNKIRHRMGLPSKFGPGGRRKKEYATS